MTTPENIPLPEPSARTTPLSTTSTLFWRLFVPVFTTVILTASTLVLWLVSEEELYMSYPILWVRIGISAIWLGWVFFLKRTLWQLRRVDADETYLYVTNYWKTARYLWQDIDQYTESRRLGRKIGHFHLKGAGIFGLKISFLPAAHLVKWMNDHQLSYLFK